MYGFCSSNALYSTSLSFRMFIFLLTPFDTWDCYYFGSKIKSQSDVAYKKVAYKKAWVYFCLYMELHWGNIVKRKKKDKMIGQN